MLRFVAGFICGIVVASVGFSGIARLMDSGVEVVKQKSQELAQ